MKIFGSIEELVNLVFRKGSRQITLKPNQTVTYTVDRNVELPPEDANGILMSATSTATMTNKTFDANGTGNSLSNVEPADFKAESGDADKVLVRATGTGAVTSAKIVNANVDAAAAIALTKLAATTINKALVSDGSGIISASSVTSTELGHLSGVTSSVQTQLDGKVDENAPIVGATATKITFDSKGLVTAGTALAAGDMPSGIDATKIGAGSVDNTEFGYLNGVTSDIQTQINAKADSSTLSAHTGASSGVHGVTGSVVGTSDTQALTNKDIDGATASNTSRITLPKANKSVLDGLTRKQATLVYGSDTNKVYADDGSSLKEIGSGSSGINYLSGQYGADSLGTVQTSVGDVLASSTRSNPTQWGNSAATALITQSTDSTLRGTTNYLVQYTANAQFVESPLFSIDGEDLGKPLLVQFDVSGVSTSDDVQVYIARYNSSNVLQERIPVAGTASATTPFSARVPTNVTTFRGFFIPSSTSTDKYAVRWLRNANNTSMRLDTFFVGPQQITASSSAPVKAVLSLNTSTSYASGGYTQVVYDTTYSNQGLSISGLNSVIAPYTGIMTVNGFIRFSGNIAGMEVQVRRNGSLVDNSGYFYSPTSEATKNFPTLSLAVNAGEVISVAIFHTTGSTLTAGAADQNFISFEMNGVSSTQIATRAVEEYAANNSTTDADDTGTTNFTYGVQGTSTPGLIGYTALTDIRKKRVRFTTPILPTDKLEIEISPDGSNWFSMIGYREVNNFIYGIPPLNNYSGAAGSTNSGGVGIERISGSNTDIYVVFGRYCINMTSYTNTWAGFPAGYRWRVRKVSGGAAVGFPVSARNIVGDTSGTAVPAGYVGEEYVVTGTVSGIVSNTPTNIVSVTLQPGVWDIQVSINYSNTTTLGITKSYISCSKTSGTLAGDGFWTNGQFNTVTLETTTAAGTAWGVSNTGRVVVAAGTTQSYWVVGRVTTSSTCDALGRFKAVRIG